MQPPIPVIPAERYGGESKQAEKLYKDLEMPHGKTKTSFVRYCRVGLVLDSHSS